MRTEFNAVRDLLDNQLVSSDQEPVGRADGVVLVVSEGEPPRLLCLEVGFPVLMRRWHPRLGEWARRVAEKWGRKITRVPMGKVRDIGLDVEIEEGPEAAHLLGLEKMIRERVIRRIPGG